MNSVMQFRNQYIELKTWYLAWVPHLSSKITVILIFHLKSGENDKGKAHQKWECNCLNAAKVTIWNERKWIMHVKVIRYNFLAKKWNRSAILHNLKTISIRIKSIITNIVC